jgi:putative ABC transport system ATP-binding protein
MTAIPLVALNKVSKVYPIEGHPVCALDHINLQINQGEYLSFMGPSGSGKSTLLNIMGGIDRPSEGEVYLEGERIDTLREQQLLAIRRRKVAYVLQEARLLPSLTALENVMLPTAFMGHHKGVRDYALDLLQKVGLEKRAHHLVHQLSGGEAQRVCIARALINRPMLILADEPTGNLDHQTRLDIVHHFEALNAEGNTIVMVTHDPELGSRATRRILLRDGQLSEHLQANTPAPAVNSPT